MVVIDGKDLGTSEDDEHACNKTSRYAEARVFFEEKKTDLVELFRVS